MVEKYLILKLKGQTVKVKGKVFLHCELIEKLYNRLLKDGFLVDIDDLFNKVITKG